MWGRGPRFEIGSGGDFPAMTDTVVGTSTTGASQASQDEVACKGDVRKSVFLTLSDGSWRVQQSAGTSGARQGSSVLIPAHAGMRDAGSCAARGTQVITADETTVTPSQTAMRAAPRIRIISSVMR
jgi:hypothetical protein